MPLITDPLPTIGQPNATEDIDVLNLLTSIKNVLNGTVDQDDLLGALKDKLGISDVATVRRGKSIIAAAESRSNAAYGLLTTPDRVSSLVLPTDGSLSWRSRRRGRRASSTTLLRRSSSARIS